MIAIIPARGGSKRLPDKNIKLLNNKPLIAYTIEAALKCNEISEVIVTTDNKEIGEIAQAYGANVPGLRPDYLSDDRASSNDVVKYLLNIMRKDKQVDIASCVLLQPTSPLRTEMHISEAIQLYYEKDADAVISMSKENHPLSWNKYMSQDGVLGDILGYPKEVSYYPNGAIYVLSAKVVETGVYYTENTYGYLMDRRFSVDIDYEEDFDYCAYLLSRDV